MAATSSNAFSISIEPGLPSWVPAQGTFANISLNTISQITPAGWPTGNSLEIAGPFRNWCGGAYIPEFSPLGGYAVHGSGHLSAGSVLATGVFVFNLSTRLWEHVCNSSRNMRESVDSTNQYSEFDDGSPYPPHTYDGLVPLPTSLGGGPRGSLVRFFHAGGSGLNAVHAFNLNSATLGITRVIDNISMSGASFNYPMACFDSKRNGYWVLNYNGAGGLKFVNPVGWGVTAYASGYSTYGDNALIYIPDPYDCLVGCGRTSGSGGFAVFVAPLAGGGTPSFTQVSPSGTAPPDIASSGGKYGGHWSTLLQQLVSYTSNGGYTVYKLRPPVPPAPVNGSGWAWTSETLTGVGGATPETAELSNGAGPYSRFIEVPAIKCFIWADRMGGPVQAWRLTGMA